MSFLYFLLFVAVTALTIFYGGGSIFGFVDMVSIIIVATSMLLFILASGQWAVFSRGMRHFFQFHDNLEIHRNEAVEIF